MEASKQEVKPVEEEAQESRLPGVFERAEYARPEFWNKRFEEAKGFFDWYIEYSQFKRHLEEVFPISKTDKILMVGCGNSRLSEEMYDDGYSNIINIDISDVVINIMNQHTESVNKPMEFIVMDATSMPFRDASFDVVIDKGTLDALMCNPESDQEGQRLLAEMRRVCAPGGRILIVSHGSPHHRKLLFKKVIPMEGHEISWIKQTLSDTSQIINVFRSNLKNKPLKEIFNDKDAFKESMDQCKVLDCDNVKFS
eukprot:TRINITY_DN2151_c0_g1_i3.p1 TRINITY_DN2151_c0_g1~~TRINITY_DN2151_c0_g1_i3.p1  ORF type:complete len:254 (-),score=58.78 TRINITY_DN2151_c0_g1_i3:322-1083(-)